MSGPPHPPTHPPTPDNDRLVHRAIDERLRRVPPLDRAAIDRVVQAAAAARLAEPEAPFVAPTPVRARSVRLWGAISLAAAAGIIGFVARGEWAGRSAPLVQRAETVASALAKPPQSSARFAAADPSVVVAVPAQFVFENAKAKRVSVVGDFNNWNATAAPMEQSANGVWSAVVPILPGRHVYAFMVDDSMLTLDPRAPKVRDPDFGTDGSLRMVGRP